MKRFVFSLLLALLALVVLCCNSRKPSIDDKLVSLYHPVSGEQFFEPTELLGILVDQGGGMIMVFDEAGSEKLKRATSVSSLHGKDVTVCLGSERVGQLRVWNGFGGGFLAFRGDFSDHLKRFRLAGGKVVAVEDLPLSGQSARRELAN